MDFSLILLGFSAIVISIVISIIRLLTKKSLKIPLIILALGFTSFFVGMFLLGTNVLDTKNENKAVNDSIEIEEGEAEKEKAEKEKAEKEKAEKEKAEKEKAEKEKAEKEKAEKEKAEKEKAEKEKAEKEKAEKEKAKKEKAEKEKAEKEKAEKEKAEKEKAEKEKAEKEKAEKEKADFKKEAEPIDYKHLSKNPDRYAGEYVKYSGKIIEINEGSGFTQLRLALDDWGSDVLYVEYGDYTDFVEDDYITIYGIVYGDFSYTSQAGWQISIPGILAEVIE